MSFSRILDTYQTLRRRLILHAGDGVFEEIAVALPKNVSDELSFLRLVLWSYALVQEAGRVSLKFLQELPPLSSVSQNTLLPEVSFLRTWATHNLSLGNKSDKKNLTLAWGWFRENCGVSVPDKEAHWSDCFNALCNKLQDVLSAGLSACELLDHPSDGENLVNSLKSRANRNWPAFQFDTHVDKAIHNLGYSGLDVVSFRNRYLQSWRTVVTTATDGGIERLLTLRIEADLITHLGAALPFTASEIQKRIRVESQHEIATLMLALRSYPDKSAANIEDILVEISKGLDIQ